MNTDVAIVQKDALDAIISQARSDVLRHFNEFVSPNQEIADLLKDGAALARENRGVLPSSHSATGELRRFIERCRKRGVPLSNLENVGIEVCEECPNLSVDRSHQPFWKEEIVALDLVAAELKGADVVNAGVERQRARAARFISLLA